MEEGFGQARLGRDLMQRRGGVRLKTRLRRKVVVDALCLLRFRQFLRQIAQHFALCCTRPLGLRVVLYQSRVRDPFEHGGLAVPFFPDQHGFVAAV